MNNNLKVDIITLFPEIFSPLKESIMGRAIAENILKLNIIDLRDFTNDARRTVDDKPYGGGPGMLMKPEPLFDAVESIKTEDSFVILTTPQGTPFKQSVAMDLTEKKHIIIVCGHYEGFDERVKEIIDMEISIGDFVLTSGNLPAMVITDAVVRLLPGVLGSEESAISESFSENLLEYPQYTRPPEFRGMKVPEILLSGNHAKIAEWRKKKAYESTVEKRPDLLK